MKTKFVFIFFILFNPCLSQAQLSTFAIADYARPNLERRTGAISGVFSARNILSGGDVVDRDVDLNISGLGRWRSTKFVNTEKNQIQAGTGLDFRLSYTLDNDFNGDKNIVEVRPIIQRDYSNKRFWKNEKFFEWGYDFDFDFTHKSFDDAIENKRLSERDHDYTIEMPFFIGKGRLELVNDAWHAVTILEFLQDQGLLENGDPDHQLTQAFAERISEIKQFRNTDLRLERIAEFDALSAFLVDNQLINPEKYSSFALLRDAWEFESFVTRLSGSEFKFGLVASSDFTRSADGEVRGPFNVYNELLSLQLLPTIEYNYYKPLSIDWQLNLQNRLSVGHAWNNLLNRFSVLSDESWRGIFTSNWEIAYLPNQRTNYTVGLATTLRVSDFASQIVNYPVHTQFLSSLNLGYQYYVSPRLSWNVSASIALSTSKWEEFNFSNTNNLVISTSYRLF